jgi:glycosyltransferase involved in cell wall biosynthesis
MSARPVLSVVTPSYNSGRYLEHALDSVAGLAAPKEHIVVDGGSTDGTVQLLQRRRDQHLVWTSEPDRGQTNAVNKGLERARGELVGWLNADDEYVPDAVDRAIALLQGDPELDVVFGGMYVVNAGGDVRRRYIPGRFRWWRYLYLGDYIVTPAIIFRRRLLERTGLLDESYADAADYDFYLRLFSSSRVARIPEPLVRFRHHAESKSVRGRDVQIREALQIRLKWASRPHQRALMRALDVVMHRLLLPLSPWRWMYERGAERP